VYSVLPRPSLKLKEVRKDLFSRVESSFGLTEKNNENNRTLKKSKAENQTNWGKKD